MSNLPNCPKCGSEYTYEDMHLIVCPECAHEWVPASEEDEVEEVAEEVKKTRDANGNPLEDGVDVIVIKDLKVRGSSDPIKQGTKVKGIRIVENPSDGHDIDCKVPSFGAMKLKSEFVKKA